MQAAASATPPLRLCVRRPFDNERNLIDTVINSWDIDTIRQFNYTNDKAGCRDAREDRGTAIASNQNTTFGYNQLPPRSHHVPPGRPGE